MSDFAGGHSPDPNGPELVMMLRHIGEGADPLRDQLWQVSLGSALWHGVLFSIGGQRLLTALAGIGEVMHYPDFVAAIPGAPHWALGVANHRGSLLPLYDLGALLLGTPSGKPSQGRVMVLGGDSGECGLLVDEIIGIRRLHGQHVVRDRIPETAFGELVDRFYRDGDDLLPAIDLTAIYALPAFREPMSSQTGQWK